jgi:hypothetical protein
MLLARLRSAVAPSCWVKATNRYGESGRLKLEYRELGVAWLMIFRKSGSDGFTRPVVSLSM